MYPLGSVGHAHNICAPIINTRGSDTLDATCEATANHEEHTDNDIQEYVRLSMLCHDWCCTVVCHVFAATGTTLIYIRLEKLTSTDRSDPSETKQPKASQKNNVPCEHTFRTKLRSCTCWLSSIKARIERDMLPIHSGGVGLSNLNGLEGLGNSGAWGEAEF